jgi:hypothetical protein
MDPVWQGLKVAMTITWPQFFFLANAQCLMACRDIPVYVLTTNK